MAEVIAALGVAASVAQLADYGFKLSIKLFSYSQAVSQADASIKGISNDVSLTSIVLQELCGILKSDEIHIVSSSAVEATQQTVKECLQIFEELSGALDKSLGALGINEKGKAKKGRVALEKLKWPFKQQKMELLRSNLDRLKASLTLMLQVLSYARSVSSREEIESSFEYQKHLIESLARSERATRRKYNALQVAIEGKDINEDFDVTISTSTVTLSKDFDFESQKVRAPAEVKPKILVGELLLCFQLLSELLRAHLAISKDTERSPAIYEEFNIHLEKLSQTELQRLEKEHGDTSTLMKAEAAKKLQTRLGVLAKASGFVVKETMENSRPTIFYAREESYNRGRTGEHTSVIDERAERSLSYTEEDEGVPKRRVNLMHEEAGGMYPGIPCKSVWFRVLDNIIGTTSIPASDKTSLSFGKFADLAPKEHEGLSSSEKEDMPQNIVQSLLSEWTTLPTQER